MTAFDKAWAIVKNENEVPIDECKGCGLAHGSPNSEYCSEINQPTLAYGRKPNQKPVLNSKYIRQPMLTVGLLSGISPKAAVGKRRARRKRNDFRF